MLSCWHVDVCGCASLVPVEKVSPKSAGHEAKCVGIVSDGSAISACAETNVLAPCAVVGDVTP